MHTRFSLLAIVVCALAVFALAQPVLAGEKISGVITAVEPDDHTFVVKSGDKEQTFSLMLTAPVQVDGENADMYKLKVGQKVDVTFEEKGDQNMATEVNATSE